MARFNLVASPWVPVRTLEGDLVDVTLHDALLDARNFRRIEDQSPLVVAALHRLLLAVLHRALKGPANVHQTGSWLTSGFPVSDVADYLSGWRDRFELFHPLHPFYQVADFGLELNKRSWTILAAELNQDNNKVLFDHTITSRPPPLSPAQAARLLVANQTFAVSAGKSVLAHTTSAPIATAATVIALGDNLHETLGLNLVPYPSSLQALDRPVWESDPVDVATMRTGPRKAAYGLTERYTWLSRSVRLEPEVGANGEPVIRWIAYASGIRYEESGEFSPDPMVAYRKDKKRGFEPYKLRRDRGFWRDYAALVPHQTEASTDMAPWVIRNAQKTYEAVGRRQAPFRAVVLGQVTDKAKIELWRSEVHNLPEALLADREVHDVLMNALALAEDVGRGTLGTATWRLAAGLLAGDDRQPHREDIAKLAHTFPGQSAYWSALERRFGELVALLDPEFVPEQVERWWLQVLLDTANSAWSMTRAAAGQGGRALKAVLEAERSLAVGLAKIHEQLQALDTGA